MCYGHMLLVAKRVWGSYGDIKTNRVPLVNRLFCDCIDPETSDLVDR